MQILQTPVRHSQVMHWFTYQITVHDQLPTIILLLWQIDGTHAAISWSCLYVKSCEDLVYQFGQFFLHAWHHRKKIIFLYSFIRFPLSNLNSYWAHSAVLWLVIVLMQQSFRKLLTKCCLTVVVQCWGRPGGVHLHSLCVLPYTFFGLTYDLLCLQTHNCNYCTQLQWFSCDKSGYNIIIQSHTN